MSLHLIFVAALALAAVCAAPAPSEEITVADTAICVYTKVKREDSNEKNSACYKKCMEKHSPVALLENPRGQPDKIYLFCYQPLQKVQSSEEHYPTNMVN